MSVSIPRLFDQSVAASNKQRATSVMLVEEFVDRRANAPYHFPIAPGDKKIRFGMLKKRMLFPVQWQISIHIKRWHPLWTIFIQPVWKVYKLLDLGFVVCVDFFDGEHENLQEGNWRAY
jgi:hypothetical protein